MQPTYFEYFCYLLATSLLNGIWYVIDINFLFEGSLYYTGLWFVDGHGLKRIGLVSVISRLSSAGFIPLYGG